MRHKQTEEHKLSYFLSKAIFKIILRMENIGQIYREIKSIKSIIYEMTIALEEHLWDKTFPNLKLFLVPNLMKI